MSLSLIATYSSWVLSVKVSQWPSTESWADTY